MHKRHNLKKSNKLFSENDIGSRGKSEENVINLSNRCVHQVERLIIYL